MKFDSLLRDYYEEKTQLTLGIPTVQYCADKLCMSPNYFGDMIKKTTGDTASNYIRQYVIQRAKSDFATGASIAQVADGLGFEYPQHLSLLRHVRHIHHFNITGGEPSLNVRAIRHILERVRAYGITVNDFSSFGPQATSQ